MMVSFRTGAAPFGLREPIPSPPRGAMVSSGVVTRRRNRRDAHRARASQLLPDDPACLFASARCAVERVADEICPRHTDSTTRTPTISSRAARPESRPLTGDPFFRPAIRQVRERANQRPTGEPSPSAHAPARIGARRRRDEPTRERGASPTRRRGERQSRRAMPVRVVRFPRGPALPVSPSASRNVTARKRPRLMT